MANGHALRVNKLEKDIDFDPPHNVEDMNRLMELMEPVISTATFHRIFASPNYSNGNSNGNGHPYSNGNNPAHTSSGFDPDSSGISDLPPPPQRHMRRVTSSLLRGLWAQTMQTSASNTSQSTSPWTQSQPEWERKRTSDAQPLFLRAVASLAGSAALGLGRLRISRLEYKIQGPRRNLSPDVWAEQESTEWSWSWSWRGGEPLPPDDGETEPGRMRKWRDLMDGAFRLPGLDAFARSPDAFITPSTSNDQTATPSGQALNMTSPLVPMLPPPTPEGAHEAEYWKQQYFALRRVAGEQESLLTRVQGEIEGLFGRVGRVADL
jgi:hypothetical protein